MLASIFFLILLFILELSGVSAKCCNADGGGDCGDNSAGTPCCGYHRCNGFCCACDGVQIIREPVDDHPAGVLWTSVITAPPGETWTCRASHITTWGPTPTRMVKRLFSSVVDNLDGNGQAASITEMARQAAPTSPNPPPNDSEEQAHFQKTFNRVCGGRKHNGASVIGLDDYLAYFNVTENRKASAFGKGVAAKFHAHDTNGDGMLSFQEAQLRCDQDGCNS